MQDRFVELHGNYCDKCFAACSVFHRICYSKPDGGLLQHEYGVSGLVAHITFCTPYVVLNVLPKLTQMNPNVYEAALDLGATPFQALRKVLIPLLKPGMISGFIMAFTMSLDDFAVTFFTRGTIGLDTLSTYIYTDARKGGLTPELRPLITLLFVGILILLIVINIRQIRNSNTENK